MLITVPWRPVQRLDQLEHKLASDMVKVEHWSFLNKMVLNIKKKQDHNIPEASQILTSQ